MAPPPTSLELFVATAPGLEGILSRELTALGVRQLTPTAGGIGFRGTLADVERANLHLRTASRVIVRIATFQATSFHELERGARRIPWSDFIAPGQVTRLRVTCRKSRLYHSGAVAQRVADAIERVTGSGAVTGAPDPDDDDPAIESQPHRSGQLFVVRVYQDRVTISADSSGELLHRRGYRRAVGKAPIRETLAAAMVLESGWVPGTPFVDPFCGSGTLVIEAAMIARNIPPGLLRAHERNFPFLMWPAFDVQAWNAEITAAKDAIAPNLSPPLRGYDRDAGAIEAAQANADRAGVANDVRFERQAMSALARSDGAGSVITNPPYGVRVGEKEELRDLYDGFGAVLRERFPNWTVGMLSTRGELERRLRLPLKSVFATRNGGIPVRFSTARIT